MRVVMFSRGNSQTVLLGSCAWSPLQEGRVHSGPWAYHQLIIPYRGNSGLDPALYLWRLSLYCPGQCVA